MTYINIQPPFTLKFSERTKKELVEYYEWFFEILPSRMEMLCAAVNAEEKGVVWEPRFMRESLERLGHWMVSAVGTRQRTPEEVAEINAGSKYPLTITDDALTTRTYSVAMDVGMYLGKTFEVSHPSLRWGQILSGKRNIDYGQPVLMGFKHDIPFNPVGVALVVAGRIAHGRGSARGLVEVFDIWSENVVGTSGGTRPENRRSLS